MSDERIIENIRISKEKVNVNLFEKKWEKEIKLKNQKRTLFFYLYYMLIINILFLVYTIFIILIYKINYSSSIICMCYNSFFILFEFILIVIIYPKIRNDDFFKEKKKYIQKNLLTFEAFNLSKILIEITFAYSILPRNTDISAGVVTLFLYLLVLNISVFNYFKFILKFRCIGNKRFSAVLIILMIISILSSLIFTNQDDPKLYIQDCLSNSSIRNNKIYETFIEIAKLFLYSTIFISNFINLKINQIVINLKKKVDFLTSIVDFMKHNFEDSNKIGFILISQIANFNNNEFIKSYETENFFKNLSEFINTKNKLNSFYKSYNHIPFTNYSNTISNINFLKNIPKIDLEKNNFFSSTSSLNNYFNSEKKFGNNCLKNNSQNYYNFNNNNEKLSETFCRRRSSLFTIDSRNHILNKKIPYSSNNLSMLRENIKINLPKRVSSNPMIFNNLDLNPLDQIEEISEGELSQVVNKNSKKIIGFKRPSYLKLSSKNKLEMKKLTPRNSVYLNPMLNSTTFKLGSSDKVVKKSYSGKKNKIELSKIEDAINDRNYKDRLTHKNESANSLENFNMSNTIRRTKLLSSIKASVLNYEDLKFSSDLINQMKNSQILSKEIFSKEEPSSKSDSDSIESFKSKDNDNISNIENSKNDYNIQINDDQNLYIEYCNQIKNKNTKILNAKRDFILKKKSNVKNEKTQKVFKKKYESDKNNIMSLKIENNLKNEISEKEGNTSKIRYSNPELKFSEISEKLFENNLNINFNRKKNLNNNIVIPKLPIDYSNSIKNFAFNSDKSENMIDLEDKIDFKKKEGKTDSNSYKKSEEFILENINKNDLNKIIDRKNQFNWEFGSPIDPLKNYMMKDEKEISYLKKNFNTNIKNENEAKNKDYSSSFFTNTNQNMLLNDNLEFLNKIVNTNLNLEKKKKSLNLFNIKKKKKNKLKKTIIF